MYDTKGNVENQKKLYKGDKGSICLRCAKMNDDCFETVKVTDKPLSKDSRFSRVVKCGSFKDLNKAQDS